MGGAALYRVTTRHRGRPPSPSASLSRVGTVVGGGRRGRGSGASLGEEGDSARHGEFEVPHFLRWLRSVVGDLPSEEQRWVNLNSVPCPRTAGCSTGTHAFPQRLSSGRRRAPSASVRRSGTPMGSPAPAAALSPSTPLPPLPPARAPALTRRSPEAGGPPPRGARPAGVVVVDGVGWGWRGEGWGVSDA